MKIELSSQRREMLLFLTTNMAAMTSRANQQYANQSHNFTNLNFCDVALLSNLPGYEQLWQKAKEIETSETLVIELNCIDTNRLSLFLGTSWPARPSRTSCK